MTARLGPQLEVVQGVLELRSVCRQPINIRGFNRGVSITTRIPYPYFHYNHHYIRTACDSPAPTAQQCGGMLLSVGYPAP
jgi:hypothetical protein